MAQLYENLAENLNLAAKPTVASYLYDGGEPIEIIAQIEVGQPPGTLGGSGGTYLAQCYLDGAPVLPETTISVEAGTLRFFMTTRPIPVNPGQLFSITVLGQADDTSVNVYATIRNATPLRSEELFGAGSVLVDHNYGGTDNLRVVDPSGAGVRDALIQAFLSSDYEAGNTEQTFIKGVTHTDMDGRWVHPLRLDPGSYRLVVSHPNYRVDVVSLEVSQ